MDIQLELLEYHGGQKKIIENAGRFNWVNCGRRFGKTTLGSDLLIDPALDGFPTSWFSPTYKDLSEVWKETKRVVGPAIKKKDEQIKQITLYTGGIMDFWSLDNPDTGRGRKYKRICGDEIAKIKCFTRAWQENLRATLTDYEGDAWFFSTPKGTANHWHGLCQQAKKGLNGNVYHYAPSSFNPHLSKKELDAARRELPPLIFAQEYEARFVNLNAVRFFHSFKSDIHVSQKSLPYDEFESLWLVFDFNFSPCTCTVFQVTQSQVNALRVHQVEGGTEALMQEIAPIYEDWEMGLKVTGDFSGNQKRSSSNRTDYEIIQEYLNIPTGNYIDTETANSQHKYSRTICNQFLHLVPFKIDPNYCEPLISDLETAQPTSQGKLLKDRENHKQDAGDTFRYFVSAVAPNGVKDIRTLAQILKAKIEQ